MQLRTVFLALMGMSAAVEASALRGRPEFDMLVARQNKGGNNGGAAAQQAAAAKAAAAKGGNNNAAGGNNGGGSTCLSTNAVQTGSANSGAQGAGAGQSNSKTDNANFINFCAGKTLTNGLQQKQGSCNGVVMGEMPAQANMVSTIITSPIPGKEPAANQDFNVQVKIANMQLGTFTNPDSTYYSAPQQLGTGGDVIGHTHITIQDMGKSLNPGTPLDASKFAFFKGINDAGDGKGTLQATVTGGLPAGNYRICTMAGSSNHQPVLMPVAQRGAQDDCMRITIAAKAGGAGAGAGNANAGNANNAAAGKAGANAGGAGANAAAGKAGANAGAAAGKGGAAGGKGN